MAEPRSAPGGPNPPAYFWMAVFLMIALHLLPPSPRIIPAPWKYLGLIPMLVGFAVNIQLSGLFKRLDTTIKPFEESRVLVTEGHFRYSRNPMYLWMTNVLLGLFVLLGSLLPLLVPPLFALLLNFRFIMAEETVMETKFGESFRDYRDSVRRWI